MESVSRHTYAFTRVSGNRKTGPIPVTTTNRTSCPSTCSFKGNGCYAEAGPLAWQWRKLDDGGLTLDELCDKLKALPRGQLVRHNQAGDLPSHDDLIDVQALERLVDASSRLSVFTYTHHDPLEFQNHDAILAANKAGFAVNLSAETLAEADFYADLGIAPVAVTLPRDQRTPVTTPKGRLVAVCPAYNVDITCDRCQICAKPDRKALIGFPAHGNSAARVERVFWAKHE